MVKVKKIDWWAVPEVSLQKKRYNLKILCELSKLNSKEQNMK